MPRRKSNSQVMIGAPTVYGEPLEKQLLTAVADWLDPPQQYTVVQEEVWSPPQDITEWAPASFIDPVTSKKIVLFPHQIRLLKTIFQMIWGNLVTTVIWSEVKKSGKTTIAGLVGAYWATFLEPPNEIISVANDKEQAKGRIYDAMVPTLASLGWDIPEVNPLMSNPLTRTVVKAISTNYAGEAGGNYGLTLWSELWAYMKESRKRLWEEMTPVPTRKYSVRWVETYAGFKDESELLWDKYCQAFQDGDETKPLGQRVVGLEDLPVWYLEEAKMLVYWSHTPRMPWQTPIYYAQQRRDLRSNAFARLHENRWVESTDVFITAEMWDVLEFCETLDSEHGDRRPITLGADAGVHNDFAALVASTWNDERNAPDILRAWVWEPINVQGEDKPSIDLTKTLGAKIDEILASEEHKVIGVYYDTFQLHSIMTDLKNKYDKHRTKNLIEEVNQNTGRILSDSYFYQVINEKTLRHNRDPILRQHVLNAVARTVEEKGVRLDKEKSTKKIDAAVAGSMAVYGASITKKSLKKRGFLSA